MIKVFNFLKLVFLLTILPGIALGKAVNMDEVKERALQGDAEAQFQYATHLAQEGVTDPHEVMTLLRSSASQGNYKAMSNLGIIYYFGDLGEQNYSKAFEFFKNAAEYHDVTAYYYLGLSYQNGHGTDIDQVKGAEYISKAAQLNMSHAQFALAEAYETGLGVQQDLYEAVHWYAHAANAGLEEAAEAFNRLYYSIEFVDENGDRRFFWFEEENLNSMETVAVNAKDPFYVYSSNTVLNLTDVKFSSKPIDLGFSIGWMEGQVSDDNLLARLPSDLDDLGQGVIISDLLRKSDGHTFAELLFLSKATRFGAHFVNSTAPSRIISIPKSDETHYLVERVLTEAFAEVSDEAIISRVAEANLNVAQMLFDGFGIEQDQDAAIQYYYRSAELNNARANYVLGVILRKNGDEKTSHKFFERAAYLGELSAQFNMAVDYYNGSAVSQDLEKSFYWALIVEKRGDSDIDQLINLVKEKLQSEVQAGIIDEVDALFAN